MPTNLTPAAELLAVVREFLEADILQDPNLPDEKRFNVRIAINLLATAERELRLGPAANAAEADRLTKLTRVEGSLEENNRRLANSIRERAIDAHDAHLLDHLRRTIADALRINNPKWLESSPQRSTNS